MSFPFPLVEGQLIKRYKRFLADIRLTTGEIVTAHCPNTGSMKTCGDPGDTVYLSRSDDPKRKLAYTWELTRCQGGYIAVNTSRPNAVVADAITGGDIAELSGYETLRREVRYGTNSRIDLLLESPNRPRCFVEIKSATLRVGQNVQFPDAVTSRGQKHLIELHKCVKAGDRAVIFFLVNRPDGEAFSVAKDIDPVYDKILRDVVGGGVEILAYRAENSLNGLKTGSRIPIILGSP